MEKEEQNKTPRKHKFLKFLLVVFALGIIAVVVMAFLGVFNGGSSNSNSLSQEDSTSISPSEITSPINQYVVSFDLNPYGKNKPSSQQVDEGEKVTEPVNPTKNGYDFSGWYIEKTCSGNAWDFLNDVVTSSLTLYAKWDVQTYNISFDLNGGLGPTIEPQTKNYLSYNEQDPTDEFRLTNKIIEPNGTYTKAGYEFAGWWIKDGDTFIQEWNFGSDIPKSTITLSIGWGSKKDNGTFSYIDLDNAIKITGYTGVSMPETLTIPSSIDGKPVLSIGKDAFSYTDEMYYLNLPSSLTTINEKAFFSCKSLCEVNILSHVTSIGVMAFDGCSSMYELNFEEGLNNIGEKAFYQCTSLRGEGNGAINIPSSVISIETDAFSIVTTTGDLYSIVFNDGLVYIGYHAFAYIDALSVIFPPSLEVIAREAFAYCEYLTRIDIGISIKHIGYQAFYQCGSSLYISVFNPNPISIRQATFGSFPLDDDGEPTRNLWIMVEDSLIKDAYQAKDYWSQYKKHIINYSMVDLITYPNRP